jgi:hypothetical protein
MTFATPAPRRSTSRGWRSTRSRDILGHSSPTITKLIYVKLTGRANAPPPTGWVICSRPDVGVIKGSGPTSEGRPCGVLAGAPPGTRAPNPRIKRHKPGSAVTRYRTKSRGSRLGPDCHRTGRLLSKLLSLVALVKGCYLASRRAGFALPGGVRPVQVQRPAGRTTWTGRTRSGCLRCAAEGRGLDAGIPESPGSGRAALAAGAISGW